MRFALVEGERREAARGLTGECIGCGSAMIAKVGEVVVPHWAHKSRRQCDRWWENETAWHRRWKAHFPAACQEFRHCAADGEWHIADVKTPHGWVLEFQHSSIKPEERRSRESFYEKMVWVVDGKRLPNDEPRFLKAYQFGRQLGVDSRLREVVPTDRGLLKRWVNSEVHVFFDFGDGRWIWWLSPYSDQSSALVQPISVSNFVKLHRLSRKDEALKFDLFMHTLQLFAAKCTGRSAPTNPAQLQPQPRQALRKRLVRRGRRL